MQGVKVFLENEILKQFCQMCVLFLSTVTKYFYFTPLGNQQCRTFAASLPLIFILPFYLLIISPFSPPSLLDQRRRPDLLCPKHTNIFPMMSASCPAQLGSLQLSQGSLFFLFLFPLLLLTAAADSSKIRRPRPLPSSVQAFPGSPQGNLLAPLPSSCLLWEVLRGVRVAWWASGSHTVDIYYFILSRPFCSGEQRGR